MRRVRGTILLLTCLVACSGCSRRDCLVPPSADATPPEVSLKVIYMSPDSPDPDTLLVTSADSSVYVEGRADQNVRVAYSARDSEGMKRLWLGAARLTTVGAGLDSRRIPVEPISSGCAVERLTGTWTAPTVDPGTRVTLSLSAQNWAEMQQATPTVTIRLR